MTTLSRILPSDDPLAIKLTAALKQGDVERLSHLLASEPDLAACVVRSEKGGGRTPLHLFADWPGRIANAAAIVQLLKRHGADLDAAAVDMWHRETALHWAASNDDVALIDVLLDAGADIERAGSSIDGGPPLSCAVGYGQWEGARRLVARGAKTQLWHEAALGMMEAISRRVRGGAGAPRQSLRAFLECLPWRRARRRAISLCAWRRSQLARSLVRANAARYRRASGMERCRGVASRKRCNPRNQEQLTGVLPGGRTAQAARIRRVCKAQQGFELFVAL